jgi:pimeloyl-ACP methyl ester carboxylesterase
MHAHLLILVIHGGAFLLGKPADIAPQAAQFQRLAPRAEIRNVEYPLGMPDVGYRYLRRIARNHRGLTAAYGFSAGGYLAARLAANGEVDASVSVAGLYDLPSFARFTHVSTNPWSRAFLETDTAAHRRSVALRPGHLAAPNLVLHGDSDPVAPYADARAYVRRDRRARLITMRGIGHDQPERPVLRAMRWLLGRFH